MITLNNFTKLDNNQYQMVLSMKKTDSVEDLPSEARPMSPEYFAVTIDYGVPADGSIAIKEDGEVLAYSAGEWGKAETTGDIKLKELSVKENGEYLPESGYVGFNKVVVDVKKEMPTKGDLIMLDGKQYRVLKINDTVAEVLAMYDASDKFEFNASGDNTYAESTIDTYCHSTFYSGLPEIMKSAIVDKTFTQDSWKLTSQVPAEAHYTALGVVTYYLTFVNATYGESITRHCYCLSVQDVIDYLECDTSMDSFNTTLTPKNMLQMLWNRTTTSGQNYKMWLRSAGAAITSVLANDRASGNIVNAYVASSGVAHPAFQIDLSKVDWVKSE